MIGSLQLRTEQKRDGDRLKPESKILSNWIVPMASLTKRENTKLKNLRTFYNRNIAIATER